MVQRMSPTAVTLCVLLGLASLLNPCRSAVTLFLLNESSLMISLGISFFMWLVIGCLFEKGHDACIFFFLLLDLLPTGQVCVCVLSTLKQCGLRVFYSDFHP